MGSLATVILFPEDVTIPAFFFDMTRSETHSFETELTKNPIESGGNVNDHAIHQPDKFMCSVCVSNTPLEQTWDGHGVIGPIVLTLPGYPGKVTAAGVAPPIAQRSLQAVGLQVDALEKNRVVAALDWLNERRLKVQPLLIATPIHIYEHMVLTKIELPVTRSTQFGEFALTFEHLEIVTTDQVSAPAPKEARGAPQANLGKTTTPDADPLDAAAQKGVQKAQKWLNGTDSFALDALQSIGVL